MKPGPSLQRYLPGRQPLNVKRIVYTRTKHRNPKDLPPKKPPPQNGLRIRLHQPARGATLKTAPWRIVVQDAYKSAKKEVVEQLGEYDVTPRWWRKPAPNLLDDGDWVFQKRLEWNAERLKYWIAQGARPTPRIVWLMQTTGISLDPVEHRRALAAAAEKAPTPATEYRPDVAIPNDPKHQERLRMRAQERHQKLVKLEPGSDEWLEAQLSRPEMQEDREFEAAQWEPYPIVPKALQKDPDLEPSRYAREFPVWVARASESRIDMHAAALGRPDISKPFVSPKDKALPWRLSGSKLQRKVPPLKEPAESELTRAVRKVDLGR